MKSFSSLIGLLLFAVTSVIQAQSQLGADIDGEAASDHSGGSVSMSADGSRVAIGAVSNSGSFTSAGHVRVYSWNGSGWTQLGADMNGEASNDNSGFSVALSADGNRVAIGSVGNAGGGIPGQSTGHVRVYNWSGTNWIQLGADIDGEATFDQSGASVSLSTDGSRVAIGAINNGGKGHVRVYNWSGTNWIQLGADIDGEAAGDQSGRSVSLSANGSRVAIGANNNDGSFNNAGHVRVYDWNGSIWTQFGADIDGEANGDGSGESVSLSADGNRVAIGASLNDGSFNNTGHVRVYARNGSIWTQVGADINGEAADDNSGQSVSVSADGNRVAIGARFNDGSFNNAGHVRVYDWNGSSWTQFGSDINGEAADDNSGVSVSLSGVGTRVASGAALNSGNGAQAGHVRIYSVPLQTVFKDGFEALIP